jgi:hypothetical protein
MVELSRLSERMLDVLRLFKKPNDQASVTKAMALPRTTITSVIIRLTKLGFIECTQLRNASTGHLQLYKVTEAGKAELKKRPRLTPIAPAHGGVYSKAAVGVNVTDDPRNVMTRPLYVPSPMESVRPGADDHRQYCSKGRPT